MDRTPAAHDAEQNDAAWSDRRQQFVERLSCSFKDVAQRTAERGCHIERPAFEVREIGDIEQLATFDCILVPGRGDTIAVQVKLSRRDVADKNPGSEPGQLDGEAPWARADLEHSIASMYPTALKPLMKLQADATRDAPVEAIPFGRPVPIVEDPHPVRRVVAGHFLTAGSCAACSCRSRSPAGPSPRPGKRRRRPSRRRSVCQRRAAPARSRVRSTPSADRRHRLPRRP